MAFKRIDTKLIHAGQPRIAGAVEMPIRRLREILRGHVRGAFRRKLSHGSSPRRVDTCPTAGRSMQ
jgi:hypothetical protein